jgi:hypothetical protein
MKRGLLGCRLGLIRFLNSVEDGLIKLWSTDRKPFILVEENGTLIEKPNKNFREFHSSPLIHNDDWKDAYTWNKRNKTVINLKSKFFIPAGKETKLSKIRCESYINEEQKQKWKDFDEMVSFMQSLHVVQVDFNSWQQSKCSCASWVKNLKCNHVISVCYRLYKSKKLSDQDFITAVMNLPIEPNRKRGRPTLTTQAELRQPNEAQNEENDLIEYLEEHIAKKSKIDSTNTDRPSRICKKKIDSTNTDRPIKKGPGRPKNK